MTDAELYLQMARADLVFARYILSGGFVSQAARASYMATFHAAQGFIVARTDRVPKTHSGTRTEFSRLAQTEAGIDRAHIGTLGRGYELKTNADYEESEAVTMELAETAIADATRFVDDIAALLGPL